VYPWYAYNIGMPKEERVYVRLTESEKQGFQTAASLAGLPLSAWIRERLRLAAIRDLESAGRQVPFIEPVELGESSNA